MPRTDHPHGVPAGLDHAGPDPGAAAQFYAALLGWPHPPAGVALHGPPGPAHGPATSDRAAWTIAFASPDAQATARAVHHAGGGVQPCRPDGGGQAAVLCTDPTGAVFSVRQTAAPFPPVWTELHTPDPAAARTFYRAVFAWQHYDLRAERDGCTVLHPAGAGPEEGHGAIVQLPAAEAAAGIRPHWLPYFEVLDAEAAADRTVRLGGTVRRAPRQVPGLGLLAGLTDPCGAAFAVIAADRRPTARRGHDGEEPQPWWGGGPPRRPA